MNAISTGLLIALTGALAFPAAAQQLSPEEVKQYLSGAGRGYAKAAELNHFPGPMHVLELADKLQLSAEQRKTHRRMRALLTEEQVKRYDSLRGYSTGTPHQHRKH